MLNPAKASRTALMNAAQASIERHKYAEAETLIAGVLSKDPADAPALLTMAEVLFFQGRPDIRYYMRAVCAAPSEISYKEKFIQRCWLQKAKSFDPLTGAAILHCLEAGDQVDCSKLSRFWHSHLLQMPEFKNGLGNISDLSILLMPYFLLGLKHLVVANADFEDFVTKLRHELLNTPKTDTCLIAALASYAFHTDYILYASHQEEEKVQNLKVKIESGEMSASDIAILACYMPLYKLSNALDITATEDITDLVTQQIKNYQRLQERAASVIPLTSISEGISSQVRQQYEDFPYPRWRTFSPEILAQGWEESGTARDNGLTSHIQRKGAKILIAGCGTGQEACQMSALFPEAEILAIDLSRSSLAYAMQKAEEYGFKNITFRQADILKLGEIDQKFDYITSSGVLHHLEKPEQGWRILRDLLKPDGIMMVSLYSKMARRFILEAQKIAHEKGYTGNAKSMREFRRNALEILGQERLEKIRYVDYFNLNMCRDLLFHAQEHNYNLIEIKTMLDELGIEFLGFNLSKKSKTDYAAIYPEDTLKINLMNWHRFEHEKPSTFQAMYQFWCRRKSAT